MRPRRNLSAAQLAGLGLLGNLIAVAAFAVPLTLPEHRHLTPFGFLLLMTPVLLGLGLYLWAITRIKNGVKNGTWSEDELAPLRTVTLSGALNAGAISLIFFFAIFTFFNMGNHAYRAWGWCAYLLGMFLMQLAQATKRPTVNISTAPRIDWRTRPPMQSEHWGER
jgi:hypothetical protein